MKGSWDDDEWARDQMAAALESWVERAMARDPEIRRRVMGSMGVLMNRDPEALLYPVWRFAGRAEGPEYGFHALLALHGTPLFTVEGEEICTAASVSSAFNRALYKIGGIRRGSHVDACGKTLGGRIYLSWISFPALVAFGREWDVRFDEASFRLLERAATKQREPAEAEAGVMSIAQKLSYLYGAGCIEDMRL